MQQFWAMLVKRIIHTKRNIIVTLVQILTPLVFTIIGCAVLKTFPGPREPPLLDLFLKHWEFSVSPYLIRNDTAMDKAVDLGQAYADFTQRYSTVVDVSKESALGDMDIC